MKYKIIYMFLALLIIFFSINGVSEGVNESNYTVEYDLAILEEFNNQTWVPVLVRLVDNSNVTIAGTKEEKVDLMRQRDEWFKAKLDEVLSILLEDEINETRRHISEFRGKISESGFYKLINNTDIKEIIWENTPLPEIATNESISVDYDREILDALSNQTWVPVLVRLVDNSNITVTGSKEERRALSRQRDEWFKPVREEVLATLSETEFELSSRLFNGFSGTITKEGFDKLLNNTAVRKIIWDNTPLPEATTNENVSVSENVSQIEKKTESEIITNTSISEGTSEIEEKSMVWIWITIILIILFILGIYLLFKKKK